MSNDQNTAFTGDANALEIQNETAHERRRRLEHGASQPKKAGFTAAITKLFGMGDTEPSVADENDNPPDPEHNSASDTIYERIGTFLSKHQLDPSPDNYTLAWEYFLLPQSTLGWAVDRAIETEGELRATTAQLLLSQHRTKLSAENLNDLISEAQTRINDGSQLVQQSHADAKAYGSALKSELDGMEGEPALTSLTRLTKSMIDRTSEAESQLRDAAKQLATMQDRLAEAEKRAESDALTGLANRRAFEKVLARAIDSCREEALPLAVAFCDIDHFKRINDSHGHATGDRVLKYVANLLAKISGGNCHVARHGGEEFVILLKGRTAEEAYEVVDIARHDLSSRTLFAKNTEAPIGRVSFSAGIAAIDGRSTAYCNSSDLLHRADLALYRAKEEGRNRVCM